MKEYNKEKLHEYAKELFALCLDKGIRFEKSGFVIIVGSYDCNISKKYFNYGFKSSMPIWELIEKVKQL